MDKRKLIELALAYEEAPENVQQAAAELNIAFERASKADQQASLWAKEKELANRGIQTAERTLEMALEKWDSKTVKPKEKEEMNP